MANDKKASERAQMTQAVSLIGSLGSTMLGCIGLGFAAGFLVDRLAGTKPLFLIVFLLFGVAAGMIRVYRMVMKTLD